MQKRYRKCRFKSGKTMIEQSYYQNVLYVAVKNKDLLKNKKQKDY